MCRLSRQPCKTCGEDTIHKGIICIHCGSTFKPWKGKIVKFTRKVLGKQMIARRRGSPKAKPGRSVPKRRATEAIQPLVA
jgi:hypothetical protein